VRWPRESEETPDGHRKTTSPDQMFPADARFQNLHFGVRGVLHCFERGRYSLLRSVRPDHRSQTGRAGFPAHGEIYAASSILVTNLSGASRSKRRLVEFKDIPKVLVDAVTAGEDQSFFSHHGVEWIHSGSSAHSFRIFTRLIDCKAAARSRSSLHEAADGGELKSYK
jgi:membrane peptidoglycan carboxypeptidase